MWACFAIILDSSAQKYFFASYNVEQGLPQSELWSLLLDKRGYLWGGTNGGGLVRFKGNGFEIINTQDGLPSNQCRPEFEDAQGRMWISTFGGVACYDGLKMTKYSSKEGVSEGFFSFIFTDNEHTIWLIDQQSRLLKILKNNRFVEQNQFKELQNKPIAFLSELQNGRVFLSVSAQENYYLHKGELQKVDFKLYKNLQSGTLVLFEQKDGTLWLQNSGRYFFLKNNLLREVQLPADLVNNIAPYRPFWEDSKGRIWIIAANTRGVFCYEKEAFTRFGNENSSSRYVITSRCLAEDNEGNIWLGTSGAGLLRYSGSAITQYWENQAVRSFWRGKDSVFWTGLLGGVIRTTPDGKEQSFLMDNPATGMIKTITEGPENEIYLSSMGGSGVFCYKNNQLSNITQRFKDALPPNTPVSYAGFIDSSFVIATWGTGFYFIKNNKTENFNVANGKAPANVIHSILKDKQNRIWVCTNVGLLCIEGSKRTVYTDKNGLKHLLCIHLAQDKNGMIWVATYGGGLARFDGEKFIHYDKTNSLIQSDVLYSVVADDEGNLWLGTQNGINQLILNDKSDIIGVRHFDKNDGFLTNETNGTAVYKDYDGSIWFGTINGAFRCDPKQLAQVPVRPKVAITGLRLFFKPIDWLTDTYKSYHKGIRAWFKLPHELILPHSENHVSFDFEAISYKTPEKVLLQWQLEGIDKTWSVESGKTEASYPNLPHGNYIFKVRARHMDGEWSEPVLYAFTIQTPWYYQWWVQILFALTLVLVVVMIFKARTAALKARQIELERLVNEKTAEVRLQNQQIMLKNSELEQQKEEILIQSENLKCANEEIKEKSMLIEHKNQDIVASIHYAQRIQNAMLPFEERIAQTLNDFFVFYKPRDIVSGDFYWFADLSQANISSVRNKELSVLVVADCTGHGVPGAFMSMIGNQLLYEIIIQAEVIMPHDILARMNIEIIRSLRQKETLNRDGMDIGIVLIDKIQKSLHFAGANNDLFLVENGGGTVIKGNRWGLGGADRHHPDFNLNTVQYEISSMFYMYSDGYQDQFGGEKGRKFMSRNFKKLLESIAHLPVKAQKQALEQTLTEWVEPNHKQVDDILVFGVRL